MNKKLLWLSDSPLMPTGYATVTKEVCNRLVNNHGWEVHVLSHNYIGQTLPPGIKFMDGDSLDFTLWGRGKEDYCRDIIKQRIKDTDARVMVTLLDTFMMYPFYLDFDFSPARPVFYFPSDGGGQLPLGCDQLLRRMALPIAMSKFAQQQAKKVHGLDVDYIPHGADESLYYPLSVNEKLSCKEKFGLSGKFVFGCVARNQGRKMLDRLLRAFKIFVTEHDVPDAVLLLHTDPWDAAATFDMNSLIVRFGLQNRVFFTGTRYFNNFTYSDMNMVYNAMDVFVLSTSGEGWGMPTVEAMSAEVPVIVTDYTTTAEIVKDNDVGIAVPLIAELTGTWNVDRGIWDDNKASDAMMKMYSNPDLRARWGSRGRETVIAHYRWDAIAALFDEKLSRLVEW